MMELAGLPDCQRMNATGLLGGQIHQLEGVSLVGLQVLRSRNFMEVSCAKFVCGACIWRAFFYWKLGGLPLIHCCFLSNQNQRIR